MVRVDENKRTYINDGNSPTTSDKIKVTLREKSYMTDPGYGSINLSPLDPILR